MAGAKIQTKDEPLIVLMDRFANSVLKQAEVAEDLSDKIAAAGVVSQWIWVKRLGYGEDQELPSLADLIAAVVADPAGAELS